jgi:DDE superfamily endonuclease/Phenazine biosynthesis-like protein
VLVIDDSGDRKDGVKTAHVGRQWLGRYGKTDSGVVTVTTLWADERVCYPVHAVPYTPARHFAKGKNDPGFRTKLAIGADLGIRAREAGFAFRAVAADSAYGDQDGFRAELAEAGLPFVMALKPRRGTRAYGADAHTAVDAARELRWGGPEDPGDWRPVARTFRDGHAETWRAADATLGWWGPDGARRLVVATADPAALPGQATWYLVTSLPRPGGPRAAGSPHPAASLAEVVRIYGMRNWAEQGYKQVKDELGWADFQVRSDIAIRRRQALVCCAFSFCWAAWFADHPPQHGDTAPQPGPGAGERGAAPRRTAALAAGAARGARLAFPLDRAAALVAGMVEGATAHALNTDRGTPLTVRFTSQFGTLIARTRDDGTITLDFPAAFPAEASAPDGLAQALGAKLGATYSTGALGDLLAVAGNEAAVRGLRPDFTALASLTRRNGIRGIIVTAAAADRHSGYDFVSRYFAPAGGIPEDPVTGSAHTALAPYWSHRLSRDSLTGLQASDRTGLVHTAVHGDRVHLTGQAVTVLDGTLDHNAG